MDFPWIFPFIIHKPSGWGANMPIWEPGARQWHNKRNRQTNRQTDSHAYIHCICIYMATCLFSGNLINSSTRTHTHTQSFAHRMCSCWGHWRGSAHGHHDTCWGLQGMRRMMMSRSKLVRDTGKRWRVAAHVRLENVQLGLGFEKFWLEECVNTIYIYIHTYVCVLLDMHIHMCFEVKQLYAQRLVQWRPKNLCACVCIDIEIQHRRT